MKKIKSVFLDNWAIGGIYKILVFKNLKYLKMEKYLKIEEVESIIFGKGVDSYNRLYRFAKLIEQIGPDDYWYLFEQAYSCSDNIRAIYPINRLLVEYPAGKPNTMMGESDKELFDSLPSKFTIFRGMDAKEYRNGDYGFSWTLEQCTADFFAHKYERNHNKQGTGKVVKLDVLKIDCLALLNGREEQEIIYLRNKMFEIKNINHFNELALRLLSGIPKAKTLDEILFAEMKYQR